MGIDAHLLDEFGPSAGEDGWLLRAWRVPDAPWLASACADPAILRWWREGHVLTEDDATRLVLDFRDRLAQRRTAQLAVVQARDAVLVGYVGVDGIDRRARVGEVSYWTAPGFRGLGVASSALRLLSPWAVDEFGLLQLIAYVDPANIASGRVAEKAGYRQSAAQQTRLGPATTFLFGA